MALGGFYASQAGAAHGLDGGLSDVEVQVPEIDLNPKSVTCNYRNIKRIVFVPVLKKLIIIAIPTNFTLNLIKTILNECSPYRRQDELVQQGLQRRVQFADVLTPHLKKN